MKLLTRRKKQLDSLNQTNKLNAGFVSLDSDNSERFKYKIPLRLSKYNSDAFTAIKNTCNKIKGVIKLKLDRIDFKKASSATTVWLLNAFVEGLIVNFAVWGLLGWRFNFITIMAWGFAITQLLDLYWRLKINGTNTKLSEKH